MFRIVIVYQNLSPTLFLQSLQLPKAVRKFFMDWLIHKLRMKVLIRHLKYSIKIVTIIATKQENL